MRIALVVPEYPPTIIGGGGIVFQALCENYSLRNEVRVFSAEDPSASWMGKRFNDDKAQAADVIRYPLLPLFRDDSSLRTVLPPNARSTLSLWEDLERWRPDVAHLHGVGYGIIDISSRFLSRLGVPYLLTDHGLPESYARRNFLVRSSYKSYHNLILKKTISKAGIITAVSSQEAAKFADIFGRDAMTIPNGVTPLPKIASKESSGVRTLLDGEYIAAAGRIAPQKGFDILLEALVDNPTLPPCIVAGDWRNSKYGYALRERAGSRMHFVGSLSRGDLFLLFAHSLAVVVPSRSEPFGLVGFEALSANARVVATKTGGFLDLSESDIPLVLVETENSSQLADGLFRALAQGDTTEAERGSIQNLMNRLDWGAISSDYESQLLSLSRSKIL